MFTVILVVLIGFGADTSLWWSIWTILFDLLCWYVLAERRIETPVHNVYNLYTTKETPRGQ